MLKELLKLKGLSKRQEKKARAIAEKFSIKNKNDLGKAYDLMFDFLFQENTQGLNILLDELTKIKFTGNFNIWVFIQPSYTLKFYLTDDKEVKQEIRQMLIEEVKSSLDSEEEHQEYLNEIRDGLLVNMSLKKIENRTLDNKADEIHYRQNLLIDYFQIYALGATGAISEQKCLEEIEINIARLKELYQK